MSEILFLFTLHENEEDFRVIGAVLARSPREAASTLGGEYIEVKNQPPGSSTNPDNLNLFGKIRFSQDLFREHSNVELVKMRLDYNPGKYYEKYPGFVIWARAGQNGREFVLRRNFVCLPQYVSH
ncbi:MAG: hypothetical protein A3H51_01695 [Candidatus Spechtbacteria bacterium RIFCSPLOWO2_02_FULL_38_8]|uniref:Uncharacterized protein n=1 Tax=Candidatus Spechtbacteria bacterium RIFCSPLOWO2_02_FULL_38_8 TaxID=1802164 RepID=A0A1G2HJ73_9BACT|nr:MAG: hypothetical protein A3H51_01695 [Candidatus Spechtbacteria bacterium RIFCSPLOWO2_02_FULL_38_8]